VLHDGRWYDEVLMSILDHEWAARPAAWPVSEPMLRTPQG
jgi:hypothetical protein